MLSIRVAYFLWLFASTLGVFQIAAAYAGLKGLSFFNRPIWGHIFGFIVIAGSYTWFFTADNRNVPSVVEAGGAGQWILCLAGFAAALLLTGIISSLLKQRAFSSTNEVGDGLEALKNATYFQILKRKLRG